MYISVYSCHLFCFCRSLPFCPLLCMKCCAWNFAWNVPLVSLIFLKRSLVFPILLFPSISWHFSLKSFLSLLTVLWNSTFRWLYIFPFLLFLSSVFSAICKNSLGSHFAFLHFFFLGIVLITTSYTVLQTSVHSSSGILSIWSNPLNLLVTSTV